ncbi:MAG TPA: recombinase family protein [Saprospiraceae bacterium]|nr:recombinase family protein [Saprospiraceae bacterium]
MNNCPKVFGYWRTSTDHQDVSPEMQMDHIEKFCEYKGFELIKPFYFDKGISAATISERPGLLKMLSDLKPEMGVAIYDLNRWSRDPETGARMLKILKEKKCKLYCKSPDLDFNTIDGEFLYGLWMNFGQMERKKIAERISHNMQQLSKEKKLRTRPPYGWRRAAENYKEKPFEKDEEQQKIISMIIDFYIGNQFGLTQIAKYLNENGYNKTLGVDKNEKQKVFFPSTIRRILVNEGIIADSSGKVKLVKDRFLDGKPQKKSR